MDENTQKSDQDWEKYQEKAGGLAEAADALSVTYRDISIIDDLVGKIEVNYSYPS